MSTTAAIETVAYHELSDEAAPPPSVPNASGNAGAAFTAETNNQINEQSKTGYRTVTYNFKFELLEGERPLQNGGFGATGKILRLS